MESYIVMINALYSRGRSIIMMSLILIRFRFLFMHAPEVLDEG